MAWQCGGGWQVIMSWVWADCHVSSQMSWLSRQPAHDCHVTPALRTLVGPWTVSELMMFCSKMGTKIKTALKSSATIKSLHTRQKSIFFKYSIGEDKILVLCWCLIRALTCQLSINLDLSSTIIHYLIDFPKFVYFMKADGINIGPKLSLFTKQMFVFAARTEIYLRNRLLPIWMWTFLNSSKTCLNFHKEKQTRPTVHYNVKP